MDRAKKDSFRLPYWLCILHKLFPWPWAKLYHLPHIKPPMCSVPIVKFLSMIGYANTRLSICQLKFQGGVTLGPGLFTFVILQMFSRKKSPRPCYLFTVKLKPAAMDTLGLFKRSQHFPCASPNGTDSLLGLEGKTQARPLTLARPCRKDRGNKSPDLRFWVTEWRPCR